ncbi:HD domain-containing protein, partial [Candidatus Marsarchaeota archaeon]|nr:HD domain-containing protein [Candidatus Marsarchaeota archaeon]
RRIIEELASSRAMERIRGIDQWGVPRKYALPQEPGYSRAEHSFGVMIVLRSLNASLEEQVAGLLHDISHAAFSHVFDLVVGTGDTESYQDSVHAEYFKEGSELAGILEKYEMDPKAISKLDAWPLMDSEMPDICADRFDNNIRYWSKMGDRKFPAMEKDSLAVMGSSMVFKAFEPAREFAYKHIEWQNENDGWGGCGDDALFRGYLFGSALRIAISEGTLEMDDFKLLNDGQVLAKLEGSKNTTVKKILSLLGERKELGYEKGSEGEGIRLGGKLRWVNPLFIDGDGLSRVSSYDKKLMEIVEQNRAKNKAGKYILSIEGIDLPIEA